jgi:glycogen synthase
VDGNGFVFSHGDANDLATKISNMMELNSKKELEKLASKSIEIADKYSFDKCLV